MDASYTLGNANLNYGDGKQVRGCLGLGAEGGKWHNGIFGGEESIS